MATVLRPPLVYRPQQKRPIATPESQQRSIALAAGERFLPLLAQQLSESAPPRKRQVQVDQYPSLNCTTLAGTAPALDLPLNAIRWTDSAPYRRRVLQVDQPPRPVWMDAVPAVLRLDQDAPPRKRQVRVDTTPNPVVLLQPLVQRWFESAPQRVKARVMVDLYPSLLETTLRPLPALTLPLGLPVDTNVKKLKYNIELDFTPNMLVLGITPAPEPTGSRRRGRIIVDKVTREFIEPKVTREVIASPKREVIEPSKPRTVIGPKKPRTTH